MSWCFLPLHNRNFENWHANFNDSIPVYPPLSLSWQDFLCLVDMFDLCRTELYIQLNHLAPLTGYEILIASLSYKPLGDKGMWQLKYMVLGDENWWNANIFIWKLLIGLCVVCSIVSLVWQWTKLNVGSPLITSLLQTLG